MGHDVGHSCYMQYRGEGLKQYVIHVKMNIYAKWACLLCFTFVNEILFKNVIVFSETRPFAFNFFY